MTRVSGCAGTTAVGLVHYTILPGCGAEGVCGGVWG